MFWVLASLSVMIPFDVETMAMPNPLSTRGISLLEEYLRKPGVDTLVMLWMADSFVSGLYFKAILIERFSSSNL